MSNEAPRQQTRAGTIIAWAMNPEFLRKTGMKEVVTLTVQLIMCCSCSRFILPDASAALTAPEPPCLAGAILTAGVAMAYRVNEDYRAWGGDRGRLLSATAGHWRPVQRRRWLRHWLAHKCSVQHSAPVLWERLFFRWEFSQSNHYRSTNPRFWGARDGDGPTDAFQTWNHGLVTIFLGQEERKIPSTVRGGESLASGSVGESCTVLFGVDVVSSGHHRGEESNCSCSAAGPTVRTPPTPPLATLENYTWESRFESGLVARFEPFFSNHRLV